MNVSPMLSNIYHAQLSQKRLVQSKITHEQISASIPLASPVRERLSLGTINDALSSSVLLRFLVSPLSICTQVLT